MLLGELEVALDVGRQLDALGVTWLVGGSVASSILGEPRATSDVDLVADLRGRHVGPLFAALVETYYIDEGATMAAVKTRGAFNVIQLASMTKVDIYCSADEALHARSSSAGSSSTSRASVCPAPLPRTSSCKSSSGSSKAEAFRIGNGATFAASFECRAMRSISRTWSAMRRLTACSSYCAAP